MTIELSLYTRKRRRKQNYNLEMQCLRLEVSQLQYRHNQLVKAILALVKGRTVNTTETRISKSIASDSELDFISSCIGNPTDDNLLTIEDEVEDLLRG
jgi:hypothetical protein